VLFILKLIFFLLDRPGSNDGDDHFDFVKYDFHSCCRHANFCLFSVPINIWEFCRLILFLKKDSMLGLTTSLFIFSTSIDITDSTNAPVLHIDEYDVV
jgi:hypothetical protein